LSAAHAIIDTVIPWQGRVANKDTVREFKGRDGTTKKVFSIEIMDESCDMKATFWDKSVDKFYDVLEVVQSTYVYCGEGGFTRMLKFKCPFDARLVYICDVV